MSYAIGQDKAGMKVCEARKTSLQKVSLSVFRFMSYFRGLNKVAFIFFPCLFFYGTAFSSTVQCPPLQYVLNHVDSNDQVTYKGSLFVNDANLYKFKNHMAFKGGSIISKPTGPEGPDVRDGHDGLYGPGDLDGMRREGGIRPRRDNRCKDEAYNIIPTFANGACVYPASPTDSIRLTVNRKCCCGSLIGKPINLKLKAAKK